MALAFFWFVVLLGVVLSVFFGVFLLASFLGLGKCVKVERFEIKKRRYPLSYYDVTEIQVFGLRYRSEKHNPYRY